MAGVTVNNINKWAKKYLLGGFINEGYPVESFSGFMQQVASIDLVGVLKMEDGQLVQVTINGMDDLINKRPEEACRAVESSFRRSLEKTFSKLDGSWFG